MSNLIKFSETTERLKKSAELQLEPLLQLLRIYGQPRLGFYDNGWHCCVEMHVAAAGTTFKVSSDFKCETPIISTRQCAERIIKTLEQFI